MKKITFIERQDDSSYDPVNTFFTKNKTVSVPKPQNISTKQSTTTKTPIQKNVIAKKQQKKSINQANQMMPQKIGQKGGSGYIPKKMPYSTQKLKQQTIYDFGQNEAIGSKKNAQKFNQTSKPNGFKNKPTQKKLDMVFDVPKPIEKYDFEEYSQKKVNIKQQYQNLDQRQNIDSRNIKTKFPQIKSPPRNAKRMGQQSTSHQNEQQKQEANAKNKYFQEKETEIENKKQKKRDSISYSQNKTYLLNNGTDKVENKNKPSCAIKNKFSLQVDQRNQQQPQQQSNQYPQQQSNRSQQKILIKNPIASNQLKSNVKNTGSKSAINKAPSSNYRGANKASQGSNSNNAKNASDKVNASNKQDGSKNQRIQQLQTYEVEYQRKIQQLQSKIQVLVKTQQKYNRLFKQHKLCQQKNKQLVQLREQLKQVRQSTRKLVTQEAIPYSKKREYLLNNQINQLKRMNRQLVLRIKSYKGTDLVEMAINKNRQEIAREFDVEYLQEYNKLNIQMESSLSVLINKVYEYLQVRSGKNKKQVISFQKEHRFLLQINTIAQKMSLTYLQRYQVSPLPKCNEDCMNLYAQIQKQKQNIFKSTSHQIVDKQDLNFAITQTNLQILNNIQQNQAQLQIVQDKILSIINPQQKLKQKQHARPGTAYGQNQPKKTSKSTVKKILFLIEIYRKRSSLSTAFFVQSLCYFTFLRQSIQIKFKNLQSQLVNLYGRLKQMKDIYDLGGSTAKQSLYLYLQSNLEEFNFLVPNLELKVKQIKSCYKEISKGIKRKMEIKNV